MRKQDKLYTVNKWNRPLFMPEKNLFYDGGNSRADYANDMLYGASPQSVNTGQANFVGTKGINLSNFRGLSSLPPLESYLPKGLSEDTYKNLAIGSMGQMQNAFHNYGKSVVDNFGKGNIFKTNNGPTINSQDASSFFGKDLSLYPEGGSDSAKAVKSGFKGAAMQAGAATALNALGSIDTGERNGLFDTLDPVYHLAGGRESGVGNALSDTGVSLTKSGNPWLMLAGAGLKIVGGLTNAAFGIKEDKAKKAAADQSIKTNSNFVSNANSFDDIKGPAAMANTDIYEGGWFSGGKADDKNAEYAENMANAYSWADRSVLNNIYNLSHDQIANFERNYSAFGGPIEMINDNDNMGAIGYGFMSDYLSTKKKQADSKNQMTNLFAGTPSSMFAIGGDLQTNGADYSTGLTHINAGGSHESSPYDGVQMGVDSEGTPNLVEEGEVVYNDYVYSARIPIDQTTKEKFHFPKKKEITYADAAKKLEKEIAERPNDPLSQAGFKAQMETLAEEQERQKAEMEAARAREAFEALSPEEQTAIMQRAAQEEAIAQQAAQEQAIAEQQVMQQPSPEQAAMMQADGSQAMIGQEPQMQACGGKINRYDTGGDLKKKLYTLLGRSTDSDFKNWLDEMGEGMLDYETIKGLIEKGDWNALSKNEDFLKAIGKENRGLAHSISLGNNLGLFTPKNDKATIQSISKGNWKTTNGKGWRGSEDLAFKQATEGLSDAEIDALTTEQLAERMRNTDAYKNTSKWLENSDNALMYLNTLLNDPDTPQVAKDYAAKFVKDGKWKEGFNYDYATVFGSNGKGVRETNPGTYWHTAMEANRGKKNINYLLNDDGTIEEIPGTTQGLVAAGTQSWQGDTDDMTVNYFTRPVATRAYADITTPKAKEGTGNGKENKPDYKAEWPRYAGLFGPAVGLGLQLTGVGKPDYNELDAIVKGAGNVALANYQPIGDYKTYRPLDIWYEQNRLDAIARAADRTIMNSSLPTASKYAALLAANYNNQLSSGNLFRQAQEYNDNLDTQAKTFNRATNQFNAEAYNRNSQFNASARNQANQVATNAKLNAAAQKLDADAGWYNSLYGNIGGLFKGLSDLGKENAQHNMIAKMWADGIPGSATHDTYTASDYLKEAKKRAKGGKNRKKHDIIL